jgi:hypothetical protein
MSLLLVLSSPAMAQGGHGKRGVATPSSQRVVQALTLSAEQQALLLWMREEEKLARDVYLHSYARWRQSIFNNIAASEQRHMAAMLNKIEAAGLEDPALAERGQFSESDLQALYDDLTAQSDLSYVDALRVGATIEDLDIRDLLLAIKATDDLSLQTTYQHLLEGSKNHLRAFVSRLQQQGEDYAPRYIEPALFEAIIGL